MNRLVALTISFFTTLVIYPVFGAEITNVTLSQSPLAQPVRNCSLSLKKLLASSNQYWIANEHPRPEDLSFLIEHHDDRKGLEFIQITNERERKIDSAPGAGHYGWVVYDPKTGELWDESRDPDQPEKLSVDSTAAQEYRSCRALDEQCFQANQNMNDDPTGGFYPNPFEIAGDFSERYVKYSQKRQPFYWSPNKNCAVQAFLVNNDKVYALSWGRNNGFVWSRYINPKTKQITEGWLPEDMLVTREQVCNDARLKSGVENPSASEFVMREVANKQQRLYFYDAPDKVCPRGENTFIVAGDNVQVLNRPAYAGYSFVRYTHPVTHNVTVGWVSASELR